MSKLRNGVLWCLLAVLGLSCQAPRLSPPDHQVAMSSNTADIVDVDTFMRSNHRPGQSASVQGVVATLDASQQMLALIDKAEFEECLTATCAALYLPVRWKGTMPAENDTIVVRGEVAAEGEKLVFVAKTIENLSTPTEKGNR